MAVLVALKVWAKELERKYFWIHVDSMAVATVSNTGASRDPELQNMLREVAMIAATHQFVLKVRHIPGVDNRLPDWLSRWGASESKRKFNLHIQDKGWKRIHITRQLLKHEHTW